MGADTSLFYWSERIGKTQARVLSFSFDITAAKTVSPLVQGAPVLTTFDAFASQAVIDAFLGTTNEFLLAQFDATSMGADAFGGLVALQGQAAKVTKFEARCYSGTGGSTLVERSVKSIATLQSSTLATEVALGANGNIGFKIDFGNTPDFDALTAGLIVVDIYWIAK